MFRESPRHINPAALVAVPIIAIGLSPIYVDGADKGTGPVDRSFNAIGVCQEGARLVITGPADKDGDFYRFPLACTKSDTVTEPLELYSLASAKNAVDPDPREPDTEAFKISISYENDRVPFVRGLVGNFPQASVIDDSEIVIDRANQYNVALNDVAITEFK